MCKEVIIHPIAMNHIVPDGPECPLAKEVTQPQTFQEVMTAFTAPH